MIRRNGGARGTTLLESMIAMAILLLGSVGFIGLNNMGMKLNDDARKMTRAASIAQDMVDNIALWPWTDPRLAAGTHLDADLTLGGTTWPGMSFAEIQEGNGFERQWVVSYVDDLGANGTFDAARVAVTVRWPVPPGQTTTYRDITVYTVKMNPSELR